MEAMEITKAILRKNIKELRDVAGWNQDDLAEATGYTRGFIADIERGKSWVSPEALEKIAEAFNVPLARLFEAHATRAGAVVDLPVRAALRKALSVPENIFNLADELNNLDDDVWEDVAETLMIAIEQRKMEKDA